MYTEVTRSLVELSQDGDEGSEEKKPNSGHPPHTRLYGVHLCACAHVCTFRVCACCGCLCIPSPAGPPDQNRKTHSPSPCLSLSLSLSLFLRFSTPSLIKNCRPWLLIKSHLKSLKVSLRLIQFAFLNREHCLKGLINWTKKCLLSAPRRQSL